MSLLLGGVEGPGFINSKYADPDSNYPDIQLQFGSGSEISDDVVAMRYVHGFTDEVWNAYYKPIMKKETWTIFPYNLRP
jgi:hypothetical protein